MMMGTSTFKTISPVATWYNGGNVDATVFYLQCTGDNLTNQATFNYSLYTVNENGYLQYTVSQGYLTMSGSDYTTWSTNDQAFTWASNELHITITGDYTPPTPVPPMP